MIGPHLDFTKAVLLLATTGDLVGSITRWKAGIGALLGAAAFGAMVALGVGDVRGHEEEINHIREAHGTLTGTVEENAEQIRQLTCLAQHLLLSEVPNTVAAAGCQLGGG